MSIMPDSWIRQMSQDNGMIEPFVDEQMRDGVISYGLSSYGYDAQVSPEFKIFTNVDSVTVDPKDFNAASFVDRNVDVCREQRRHPHDTGSIYGNGRRVWY